MNDPEPSGRPLAVSELESHIGFWLRFVSNHVSSRFRKAVEARGISVSEWVALRQLFKDGASSAGALMDALGMTKGAVSKVVTRLQEKGLVERAVACDDRRAQQIILTPAGRALVPALAALADENDDAFFGHLTPAQRRALVALMRNIVRTHGLTQVPVE